VSDRPRVPEADLAGVRTMPVGARANKVDQALLAARNLGGGKPAGFTAVDCDMIVWGVDAELDRR
jgi:hypothetical protein